MDDAALVVRAFASCGVMLATLGAIAWAVRRIRGEVAAPRTAWHLLVKRLRSAPAPARRLAVLERLSLGPGSGLALVRCGEREYVVGVGPGAPEILARLDRDAP